MSRPADRDIGMSLLEALELVAEPLPEDATPRRLLLACGFTPLHLETFLAAHLRRREPGTAFRVETGRFGDLAGTLEGAGAGFDAIVAFIEWEDLDPRLGLRRLGGWLPSQAEDVLRHARAVADRVGRALASFEGAPVVLVPPTAPLPPIQHEPGQRLGAITAELYALETRCWAAWGRIDGVRVADPAPLRADPGRHDPRATLATGFPYSVDHAERLARKATELLLPKPRLKGLITDLDDTVWGGILGEVGPEGIRWDLERGGQVHGLYQQLLASLAEAGVLIAVASKNDPELVARAFEQNRMPLQAEAVYPFEVHWEPKSGSVARILDRWNIAADAVAFVDDSPMELAEVKAAHPRIECLEFPGDDARDTLEFLVALRDRFARDRISDEDRLRLESLRAGAEWTDAAEGEGGDLETFLADAEAELVFEPVDIGDRRAFELVNKTNQFNLNGRRWTEADWTSILREPDRLAFAVTYGDRFGPLGKIAVLIGTRDGPEVAVRTWVMSCRAFARRIEHQCLRRMFEDLEVERIVLDFEATERNGPLRTFIASATGGEQEPASGPVTLTREAFEENCPRLHHACSGALCG